MSNSTQDSGENLFAGILIGVLVSSVILILASLLALEPPAPAPLVAGQQKQDLATRKEADSTRGDENAKPLATSLEKDDSQESQGPHRDKGTPHQKEPRYERPSITDWLMVLFSFVLAAFTLVQVFFLYGEMSATKTAAYAAKKSSEAAEGAIEQMQLERRAWVGVDEATLDPPMGDRPLEFRFPAKNHGTTPAFVKKYLVQPVFAPAGLSSTESFLSDTDALLDQLPESEWVLMPGDRLVYRTPPDHHPVPQARVLQIESGEMTLYMVALIRYRDITGAMRRTKICYFYNVADQTLWAHPRHSHAD